jgi:carboxylate-amine ligase
LPEQFASYAEYERHVGILKQAGLIEDASRIWWDLRPSAQFPTLETRIMDVCTNVQHGVSMVALTVCLMRMLYRLRRSNQRWRRYASMLINENRWRAMRSSFDEGMIDLAQGEIIPFRELLDELLGFVAEDAAALGCEEELAHVNDILISGTSAHQQVRVHEASIAAGRTSTEALHDVVDWLIDETVKGI